MAGLLLSSTVKAYVPMAGNAYLLDAIGATFLGTTLHPESRPSIAGTLLGVLLLSVLANGLLLIGWNFYWQQVATGVLVFLVLAVSFTGRNVEHRNGLDRCPPSGTFLRALVVYSRFFDPSKLHGAYPVSPATRNAAASSITAAMTRLTETPFV